MTLSKRERYLAITVGGIVFLLLNFALLSAFSQKNIGLRGQLESRKAQWSAMQILLSDQDLWARRNAALDAKQPRMGNENAAGVELLDTIRSLARKTAVTWENESIGAVAKSTWTRSVSISLDTHSSWPNLVAFLRQIQQPGQFTVVENADVQVDPGDQTKMLCHLKIARWFAP